MKYNRKHFIANAVLASLGTLLLPKSMRAAAFGASKASGPGTFDPSYFGIVDLHCHPSLKMYLWGRKLWRGHSAGLGVNAFDLQDDSDQLTMGSVPKEPQHKRGEDRQGLVKGIVVAHYLLEQGIHEQWDILKGIYPWFGRWFKGLAAKFEHGDWTNVDQVKQIIKLMEDQAQTAREKTGIPFTIARSYKEFKAAIDSRQFPIAHAIEGAHALGRNKSGSINKGRKQKPEENKMQLNGQDDSSQYLKNLQELKASGVCMMTLAHLFPNDIVSCVEGISPDEKKSIKMHWSYDPRKDNLPLTKVGEDVVDWMLTHGMIIDLTHSTPAARAQVFERTRSSQRPIVFTHTGAETIFEDHDEGSTYSDRKFYAERYINFKYYCASDDEIAAICACDGTIGVIPEVFWLAAGNTHLRRHGIPPKNFRNGIPYMVETIKYINSRTPDQDFNHLSIGTDFDGFSDEPRDLYEASQLDALIEALRTEKISDENIQKITSGNALRVLEKGWL
jgi:microsomal dipeptidase-like Zn-dependent dipeptidase